LKDELIFAGFAPVFSGLILSTESGKSRLMCNLQGHARASKVPDWANNPKEIIKVPVYVSSMKTSTLTMEAIC
jgi:hypothetical protein